jgi:hypothetical protein
MITVRIVGVEALTTRLQSMKRAWAEAPRVIVHEAAEVLKRALQDEAPERSGALKRGIRYRVVPLGPALVARFTSDASYAPFVIHGTQPHEIWAGFYTGRSDKKGLFWPGADHPTPYVQHPGTAANAFTDRAMWRVGPEVRAILDQTGRALVSDDPMSAVFWAGSQAA